LASKPLYFQLWHTDEFFHQSAKKNHQPIYKAPLMLAEASEDSGHHDKQNCHHCIETENPPKEKGEKYKTKYKSNN
jgi:hypothetical protein